MNTHEKRFFGCVAQLQHNTNHVNSPSGLSDWDFKENTHAIDGYKIAIGTGPHVRPRQVRPRQGPEVAPVVTAVQVGETTHCGFGLDLSHTFSNDHRVPFLANDDTCVGFIHCIETAPAVRGTAQLRVNFSLKSTTASPGVVRVRGTPMLGKHNEHLVFIKTEMPTGWPEADHPERFETFITGRTAAYAATDRLYLGIPWLHRHGELIVAVDLEDVRLASRHVRAQVTPAPAPAEDEE